MKERIGWPDGKKLACLWKDLGYFGSKKFDNYIILLFCQKLYWEGNKISDDFIKKLSKKNSLSLA